MLSIQSSYMQKSLIQLNGHPARLGAGFAIEGECLSQAGRLCPLFCAGLLSSVYLQEKS